MRFPDHFVLADTKAICAGETKPNPAKQCAGYRLPDAHCARPNGAVIHLRLFFIAQKSCAAVMLSESLLQDIKHRFAPDTINAVSLIHNGSTLPDSTEKYIIRTSRNDLILIISSEASPLLVKRAVDRQRKAKARLTGLAVEPIEIPVLEGFAAEKSYAVWRKRQPLSSNRIWSKIEKMLLAPRVYQWLRDVASQTATPADCATLIANVRRLQQVPAAPTSVRMAAEKAEHSFLSGRLLPIQVLQHGDLWTGNILKCRSRTGFIIIDWAGARFDGAPFFDLVKFAMSVGASRSTLRHEIVAHSQLLGCRPLDALAYVLSGLGALYSELEYFPESKFFDLCEQKLHALNAVISG